MRETSSAGEANIEAEIARLEERSARLLREPSEPDALAEDPGRPPSDGRHFKDYVAGLIEDFVPLAEP